MIKRLLMGSLLISSMASISAMTPESMVNGDDQQVAESLLLGDGSLMVEETPVSVEPTVQDTKMIQDSLSLAEEPSAPLKKKVSAEIEKPAQGDLEINVPEMSLETEVSLEKSPVQDEAISIAEDTQVKPEQNKADVRGVFESMTREEEDESFPG